MNDLYGIDPKAPSSISELSSLLRLFSPSEGRFIADFPMGWASEMRAHMSGLSDLCQLATVETWIKLGNHAILPAPKPYKSSLTWEENATFIRNDVVKLIGPTNKPASHLDPLAHALIDPNAFRDSRAALVPRTANAYAETAKPILLKSRKAVLIDPFITFRFKQQNSGRWWPDRRRAVVKSMLKIAQQGKHLECFEIFYVPENNIPGTEFLEEDLREIVDEIEFENLIFSIRPIKKETNTKQHARYLLGLRSGLHFDHGFDTNEDGSTNHVEWISSSVLTPLLEKFT